MADLGGFAAEESWLQARFQTLWVSGSPSAARTQIAWPNEDFTPPDAAYVRWNVRHSPGTLAAVGPNPMHRYDGTVVVEILVPADTGTGDMGTLCDAAEAVYRDCWSQQGLRFYTPYVLDIGRQGAWYKKDVMCPFVRDTVFS